MQATSRDRRRRRLLGALVGAVVLAPLLVGPPASGAPGDVGVEGPAYVESALPTVTMAESKLWSYDGRWFAAMLRTGSPSAGGSPDADVVIHEKVGSTWVPVGSPGTELEFAL